MCRCLIAAFLFGIVESRESVTIELERIFEVRWVQLNRFAWETDPGSYRQRGSIVKNPGIVHDGTGRRDCLR
jgi:hypothetical protein